ncbi:MAG: NAD(P)-dependent oxidoreductase [Chloroflexi bacterium]|nr:NAD(P)-dependent oxidoreductase [Chloroflexota bacterium]
MPSKPKVLVTGSSGLIGRVVIDHLGDRYDFSGLHRTRRPDEPDIPTIFADLSDFEASRPAFDGVDAVVHLGADPNMHGAWESVLPNNLVSTYNVYEASRQAGVKRVVFASSNHAVGMFERDEPYVRIRAGDYTGLEPGKVPQVDNRVVFRPDGYYGISKVFGEAMGSYYAEEYGLEVACLRIGTVTEADDPTANVRMKATWLSHRDTAHLIDRSLAVEGLKFEIFYGVSNNTWRFWDIEHAKDYLGYTPQDNAQDHWPNG